MTRIVQSQSGRPATSPLKHIAAAALLALTASAAPAAMAGVIDFNNFDNTFVGHTDYFETGGFRLTGESNVAGANPGDLIGAILDGSDRYSCDIACPTNNGSNYYAALNDGLLFLEASQPGGLVSVQGFDASFIGHAQGISYPAVSGLLRLQGFYANGTSVYETYQLGGPIGGNFQFQHYDTSASFASQQFASVAFFGFSCNTAGSCSAFTNNKAQFALDNIVASVPEPSTYAMMLLGLAGIGFAARRRQQA